MTRLKEIREAISNLATGQLFKSKGYSFDILPEQFFSSYDSAQLMDDTFEKYPKAFLVTDSGSNTDGVSETKDKTYRFLLGFIFKAAASDTPESVADTVDEAIEDIERLFDRNRTLGDLVHDIQVESYTTDSGFCFPRGILVARLLVTQLQTPMGI